MQLTLTLSLLGTRFQFRVGATATRRRPDDIQGIGALSRVAVDSDGKIIDFPADRIPPDIRQDLDRIGRALAKDFERFTAQRRQDREERQNRDLDQFQVPGRANHPIPPPPHTLDI